MKRRLFLSGTAAAALGLVGCGGGGGGGGAAGATDLATGVLTSTAPAAAPASSGLPAKILACYYTAFTTGGYRISDIPSEFNVIYLFHAKPNSDGSFRFEHYDEVPAADVQACRQRGQKVILTVGGASNGFNFSNRQQSQAFVASFQDIANRLGGVDGCDFNNFEANVGSSPEEMIWISRQLKAAFGEGFAITAPPQPNSAEDRAMLKAMADAGVLSWAGPQFYDWSGFNDPGFIANRTNDWVNDLGEEKVMLGLGANYDNGPSLQDCIREWDAVKMAHPNIRGMFCWSAQHNLNGGNVWGSTMKGML
jgi:chitinase